MANMPNFLEDGTPEARTWQEIERNGLQQGIDPSLGPVAIQANDPRFREAIDNLVAVRGARITEDDPAEKILRVQLAYDGPPGMVPQRPQRTEATGKESLVKA